MKINNIAFWGILIFASCGTKNHDIRSINAPSRDIREIQADAFAGDTSAYQELRIIYLDYSPEDFLFWPLMMKNRHNYHPAGEDLANCLVSSMGGSYDTFNDIDPKTQKIIIENLEYAAKGGSQSAKETLFSIKNTKK